MPSPAAERFRAWCGREEDGRALLRFRRAFTLLWLAYDVLDLSFQGSAGWNLLLHGNDGGLRYLQLGLIALQALLLFGVRPTLLALACAALRLAEARYFAPLNDFYFYTVVMLILAQAPPGRTTLAWPRDVLVWQAAWIYLATAVLKLNPEWLSGGHLFVRTQYLAAAHDWPYPELFRAWTAALSHDALLAWCGVGLELALAVALLLRAPRRPLLAAAVALHGFAAVAVNVWLFGAAMILQVALARERVDTAVQSATR